MANPGNDEKELRKHEEKSADEKHDEKSQEEKFRRDPLGAVTWALILIWAGVVLLAGNLGVLDQLAGRERGGTWDFLSSTNTWALIFVGAGVIVLAEAGLRLAMPAYSRPVRGNLIMAAIFLAIGLGQFFGWEVVWPLILIILGIAILLGGFLRRR